MLTKHVRAYVRANTHMHAYAYMYPFGESFNELL